MTSVERAENIKKTLLPLVDLGPSIVKFIAAQIEEACGELVAEIERVNAENTRLKAELEKLSCPICGSDVDGDNWKSKAEKLVEALRWVRQTIHQAHHDGAIDGCRKNTCDAIAQALADFEKGK